MTLKVRFLKFSKIKHISYAGVQANIIHSGGVLLTSVKYSTRQLSILLWIQKKMMD